MYKGVQTLSIVSMGYWVLKGMVMEKAPRDYLLDGEQGAYKNKNTRSGSPPFITFVKSLHALATLRGVDHPVTERSQTDAAAP